MMVRGHLALAGALWAWATPPALGLLGAEPLDAPVLLLSTVLAASWGAWPDIDCPPAKATEAGSGIRYGALVAMAHGPASEALSLAVYHATGGHRRATHWALTSVALGALLAVPSALWPSWTLAVVLGLVGAWPARAFLVRDWWGASLLGGIVGVASLALVPPTAWLVPVAATAGGLAHLLGDMIPKGSGVPLLGLPGRYGAGGRWGRIVRASRRRIGPGPWGLFTIGGRVERQAVTPLLGWATALGLVHAWWSTAQATLGR